jgi:hypothetical protein
VISSIAYLKTQIANQAPKSISKALAGLRNNQKHVYGLTAKHANFRVRLSGSEQRSTTSSITLFEACSQITRLNISAMVFQSENK